MEPRISMCEVIMKSLFVLFLIHFSLNSIAGEFKKDSIFNIQSEWTTPEGKKTKLSDYQGKKFLLAMIYTSCAHACPFTIQTVKDVLEKAKNLKTPVVFVSFDPKRDTPEHNKEYIKKRKLDPGMWTILTGKNDDQVRELAIVLGISYKDLGDGDFAHSNVISLVNAEGIVVEKLEGFDSPTDKIVKALNEVPAS